MNLILKKVRRKSGGMKNIRSLNLGRHGAETLRDGWAGESDFLSACGLRG